MSPKHSRQIISCWEAQEEYRHRAHFQRAMNMDASSDAAVSAPPTPSAPAGCGNICPRSNTGGNPRDTGGCPKLDIVLLMDEMLPHNS
ncbi:hypothetical protein EVAR_78107_1 [Eumeta japonica]|uniref:Uncharacterized protein n=1 Tax=Eumeta variegata TaxID=151549 RepID=A0A4C1T3X8_EUMVA|nr:hypothetical protein EVAR_78107_1 [Eumeta japonica]